MLRGRTGRCARKVSCASKREMRTVRGTTKMFTTSRIISTCILVRVLRRHVPNPRVAEASRRQLRGRKPRSGRRVSRRRANLPTGPRCGSHLPGSNAAVPQLVFHITFQPAMRKKYQHLIYRFSV